MFEKNAMISLNGPLEMKRQINEKNNKNFPQAAAVVDCFPCDNLTSQH